MTNSIPMPKLTIERIIKLIEQRQAIQAQIDVTVQTVRETLEVPADYVLRDLENGFVEPEKVRKADAEA